MARNVAVVGGGLAGLCAAAFAARKGARVTLYESVVALGGRARTREEAGFRFNMGPHALYRHGHAEAVLDELGVAPTGGAPDTSRSLGWCEGALHVLPGGTLSMLTTTLLRPAEKLSVSRALMRLPRLDPVAWDGRSLADFLRESLPTPRARALLEAVARLSTYVHAPEVLSAGLAIRQIQGALGPGVRYLDGGWQPMVDALAEAARQAGASIRSGVRVRAVSASPEAAPQLRLDGGETHGDLDAVVLAMGPAEARTLLAERCPPALAETAERALPVRAACLEVGLTRLPEPRRGFALGIDEATYLSVHSNSARGLAPEGGALVHVARYLAPDEKPEREELEAGLGALLEAVQPGWRDCVATCKLLGDVRVAHAVPTAESGGLAGRPGVRVDGMAGLYLAGDWVGPEGWLADASFASGRAAGLSAARGV